MANSRGRRKQRRALREAGLRRPPPPPASPPPAQPPPSPSPSPYLGAIFRVLKRLPRWIYVSITVVVIIIGLMQSYPWLSIQKDESLDPTNPFQTKFSVSNDGYIPIFELSAVCVVGFETDHGIKVSNSTVHTNYFAWHLGHSDRATIPLDLVYRVPAAGIGAIGIANGEKIVSANMVIRISYSFFPFAVKNFRQSQSFSLRTAPFPQDGLPHWEFVH